MLTKDLYTASDVKKVRDMLLNEQNNKCAILGEIPKDRTFVLDHEHDSEQFVRGVLEREINAYVGACENAYKRHLGYWLPMTLPDVLRGVASYLERSEATPETRWRHNGFIKKLNTWFNKLNANQQNEVLKELGKSTGKNPAERKKLFKQAALDRNLGYNTIRQAIENQQ